jgi:hypothetical protein
LSLGFRKNFIINQRFGFSFSASKFSISLLFHSALFSSLAQFQVGFTGSQN